MLVLREIFLLEGTILLHSLLISFKFDSDLSVSDESISFEKMLWMQVWIKNEVKNWKYNVKNIIMLIMIQDGTGRVLHVEQNTYKIKFLCTNVDKLK